jgi:hypothetical protein
MLTAQPQRHLDPEARFDLRLPIRYGDVAAPNPTHGFSPAR